MKDDFKDIVNLVVINWRKRPIVWERGGHIEGIAKRKQGDIAEDFIVRRIGALKPEYEIVKSKGSQTPADVFAVAKHKDYWHIMLVQVKSSIYKSEITILNDNDINQMKKLVKVVYDTIDKPIFKAKHSKKSILVSIGYAGVWRIETKKIVRHELCDADFFALYQRNLPDTLSNSAIKKIEILHNL